MYRKTHKKAAIDKKMAAMRAAKARKRESFGIERPEPWIPPRLRRVVIVIDFDIKPRVNVLKLYRTNRIDCYRAEANGTPWKDRIGWSNICKQLSRAFPRISTADE